MSLQATGTKLAEIAKSWRQVRYEGEGGRADSAYRNMLVSAKKWGWEQRQVQHQQAEGVRRAGDEDKDLGRRRRATGRGAAAEFAPSLYSSVGRVHSFIPYNDSEVRTVHATHACTGATWCNLTFH